MAKGKRQKSKVEMPFFFRVFDWEELFNSFVVWWDSVGIVRICGYFIFWGGSGVACEENK